MIEQISCIRFIVQLPVVDNWGIGRICYPIAIIPFHQSSHVLLELIEADLVNLPIWIGCSPRRCALVGDDQAQTCLRGCPHGCDLRTDQLYWLGQ